MTGVRLIHGDCLVEMSTIPDGSVDMILCDLPYGTTACKWDTVIPFPALWNHYKRLVKRNGAIVLTASQPFTSLLVCSNLEWFRYEWVWQKTRPSGATRCNYQPLRNHENVLVFSCDCPVYYPQKTETKRVMERKRTIRKGRYLGNSSMSRQFDNKGLAFPRTVQEFANPNYQALHPTQKPVALMEYLISTYTNPGETVLDNCMGSGTTGVACLNTGRNFVGIEKDVDYFCIAQKRIADAQAQIMLTI